MMKSRKAPEAGMLRKDRFLMAVVLAAVWCSNGFILLQALCIAEHRTAGVLILAFFAAMGFLSVASIQIARHLRANRKELYGEETYYLERRRMQ